MKYMRRAAGYMKWDHKRNKGILNELKIEEVTDYNKHYQENWRRCGYNKLQKGRRSTGCPMKRWRENSDCMRP